MYREIPFSAAEAGWEGEIERTAPGYVRWVQSSLNQLLGLRLAVDGISGPATRSAVRSFQQQHRLTVDGIVGPITEAALVAAGASAPPLATTSGSSAASRAAAPTTCSTAARPNCAVLEDFGFDDDSLTPFHRQQVAGIAQRVVASLDGGAPIRKLSIVGHASPEGPPDYNHDLALRRATEVEFALIDCLESIKPGSGDAGRLTLEVGSCGEEPIPYVTDPSKRRRVDVCFPPEIHLPVPALRWFQTGGTGKDAMQPVRPANDVRVLIGGKQTFEAMRRAILTAQTPDHYIYLLGWWLSDDIELKQGDPKSTIRRLFADASALGVQIRAMVWKYPVIEAGPAQIGETANRDAVAAINAVRPPGNTSVGAAILDDRTLPFGSHHQKILIVRGHEGLIAFCGGIDINPDRIQNTNRNLGEPFHDVQCSVRGPAAFDLLHIFCERWHDHPASRLPAGQPGVPLLGCSEPLPALVKDATAYVQVARTYGNRIGHRFAPGGEQSVLRMILKAIAEARRFIYIEEPFLVSMDISRALQRALPGIKKLIILTGHSDIVDLNMPMLGNLREQVYYRRQLFMAPLLAADRSRNKVGLFYLRDAANQSHRFVHSKLFVVDDEFAMIGSVNLSRRSLTHDSEAAVGIYDASCDSLAKELRIALWAGHLNVDIDPATARGREGRAALTDPVQSARLWTVRPSGAHVVSYNRAHVRVEPAFPNADAEWNRIDPDGS